MSSSAVRRVVVFLPFLVAASLHAIQETVRLGVELQVNTYTAGNERRPAVSLDASRRFVVVWHGNHDGSDYGVFGRRFDSSGMAQGPDFQVNTSTILRQYQPAVGLASNGGFVVAWGGDADGGSYGVFAQRFDASGVPQASEFQVNAYTTEKQRRPSVAVRGNGDFVVTWESRFQDGSGAGMFGRRFDSAGVPLASEFQVNSYTTGYQNYAGLAMDDSGGFVVVWRSQQDGDLDGVFARRFDSAGVPQGSELQVNTYTTGAQFLPAVAASGTGAFVVAWRSAGQDGSDNGIFAQRFDSTGTRQASEFQVTTYTTGSQTNPRASMDDEGGFVIAWDSIGQDGDVDGIFARRFDATGAPQATEFQVNTYTIDLQSSPVVAGSGGTFVVAWGSYGGHDGASGGIFAQRFATLAILDIDGDGEVAALTDGLLVLRFLFGFTGATLVNGAFDVVNCTRCNSPSIESYLQSLI